MASLKSIVSGVVLVGASAFITAQIVTAEPAKSAKDLTDKAKKDMHDATAAGGDAFTPEMMAKWEQFATPGSEHTSLKEWEGTWNLKVSHFMDENAPPMVADGKAVCKAIFDGRYIEEEVTSNFMGQPFEGKAIMGFNNGTKEYFSFWVDNMGTGYMMDHGPMTPGAKTMETKTEMYCPLREKNCEGMNKITVVDANTRKFEMWGPDLKTNKVRKCMEIVYTRAN